ncbi:MFS transporter, partial [Candidatus Bathyarchaeota archaeon]
MGRLKRFRLDFLGGGGAEEERQDLVNKSSPSTFLSRNYIVLTLTSAIWNLGYSITETYFSLYVFELGGTESVIGLVSAVASMSYILSLIIGGQLADVYGRKKVLGITTLALGASQVLLALVPNWQSLVLAVIVVNFCWIGEPAFWAMLADSIREEHRGKAYSLFSSVSFLPWVIMPYIGGKIIDVKGTLVAMRLVYFSLSVLGVLAGILHLSLLNETLTPARDITVSFRNLKGIIGITIRSLKEHFNTWLSMSRPLLALSVTYMLWSLEEGLTGPYWIVYAKEEIGISSSEWGSLVSIGNLVSLALKSFVVGKMLDKFRRMTVLL